MCFHPEKFYASCSRISRVLWLFVLFLAWISSDRLAGSIYALLIAVAWIYVLGARNPVKRMRNLLAGTACASAVLFVLLLPSIQANVEGPSGVVHWHGIARVANGVLSYQNATNLFPAASSPAQGSEYPQSWRVAVAPYLNARSPTNYDPSQSWDSPENLKMISEMPEEFGRRDLNARFMRYLSPKARDGTTGLLAVVGDETMWWTDGIQLTQAAIRDGASETILYVFAADRAVAWTQPKDLTVEEAIEYFTSPESRAGYHYYVDHFFYVAKHWTNIVHVVMADGHVRYFQALTPAQARAWLTPRGGETGKEVGRDHRVNLPLDPRTNDVRIYIKWDRIIAPVASLWPFVWMLALHREKLAQSENDLASGL